MTRGYGVGVRRIVESEPANEHLVIEYYYGNTSGEHDSAACGDRFGADASAARWCHNVPFATTVARSLLERNSRVINAWVVVL